MKPGRARALEKEPAHYDDLDLSLAEAWRLLADGVGNAASAFHQPVLATTALDGSADARVVVLRSADAASRSLRFNSDIRSGKLAELTRDPRAKVLAYDAGSKVQLRLGGRITVHHGDALAREAWAATLKYSRLAYRIAQLPGSVLAEPGDANFQDQADAECGAENFCVLVLEVMTLEWLYLAAAGHRRARFEWQTSGWQGAWLVP